MPTSAGSALRLNVIALDSNVFIYMLEAHPRFGELARDIFVAIEQTKLKACASELVFLEVSSYASLGRTGAAKVRTSLEHLGISFTPITKGVLLEAARLRREASLGALDSIHVAAALLEGCQHLITNDLQLLKRKVPYIELTALSNLKRADWFSGNHHRPAV